MKKIIVAIVTWILICFNCVYAEGITIDEYLHEIWLSPIKDIQVFNNIKMVNQQKTEEDVALYLIAPGYAKQKIGISADNEIMERQVKRRYEIYQDNVLKIYYLSENKNAYQYAKANCLKYLISDDYCLYMEGYYYSINDNTKKETKQYMPHMYCSDGTIEGYKQFHEEYCYSGGMSEEGYMFLKNTENIKSLLSENYISNVDEIKVVIIGNDSTCLYIRESDDEYLVRIYTGRYYNAESDNPYNKNENWVEELELFKLYNAKEFFRTVSDVMNEMDEVKPTYETEALDLQENGLLYGNENGLDLLKPLTRIEAATMLLRALGETTTNETAAQTFSDVPANHWGYGAAENAYSLGLIKGIGDDMFVPDDIVTGPQFATMVLRAGNHTDFNWEDALDILINEGVISAEDASTMDFFTRGDMAKIIYESIEKELF